MVFFVPHSHAESVRNAIDNAGGGHIGNYSGCTFSTDGIGTFRPEDGTNPYIGTKGELESVEETRIETIIDQRKAGGLIKAIKKKVHPYEEVAYDVYKLDMGKEYGLGRVCRLKQPMSVTQFLQHIKSRLGADTLKINYEPANTIDRFAVVTGSGASMWKNCLRVGVKVLVTGDMKHHDAIDAKENGVMIVDAGHFETERIYMKFLADKISKEFNIETVLIEEEPSIIHWR